MTIAHITQALIDLGVDIRDENFEDTPKRFHKYLESYLVPYIPEVDLGTSFTSPQSFIEGVQQLDVFNHAMVVQTNIPYRAVCAHHLLPVHGTAHVGYIPSNSVVGLSKLSRLVQGISHRSPSLQEEVGNSIVEALMECLKPVGAICVINAEHGCMHARGIEEMGVQTVTSSLRGIFQQDSKAREEFYRLVQLNT